VDTIAVSCVGFASQRLAVTDGHMDIWLEELQVDLGQALIATVGPSEMESQGLRSGELMQQLDRTPGLQSLDLGAGLIQPVIRGLYGSRVAVLEDGVPQQSGRWGSDHGVLVAPELQVANTWTAGGGHVWMGPESAGGGLRFESPSLLNTSGVNTCWGSAARFGNSRGQVFILHTDSRDDRHWHAGISGAQFGATQVPQRSFSYIGRTYTLETGELPNTGGRALHAVTGVGRRFQNQWVGGLAMRLSDVRQGLFPGIIGVPMQGDLAPGDATFAIDIPQQHASRVQAVFTLQGPSTVTGQQWIAKAASSWNQRQEFAPPHAHGWGPLPDSDLSLSLKEWNGFVEVKRSGPHATFGFQAEAQEVQTAGWEFLLPSHRRVRLSAIGETVLTRSTLSVRLDAVHAAQDGYTEPQFNASGDIVGEDVRATAFEKFKPGGMVAWQRPFRWDKRAMSGTATLALHGRAPSNYEWGANGIHHGTFRFEQGNPELTAEWTVEGRCQLKRTVSNRGWSWRADGFAALHRGFISLTPSARFAPISHAGLIYRFEANDAFRTGMEATLTRTQDRHTWEAAGSVLGQWDLRTGLGLPFTTPSQLLISWEGRTGKGSALEVTARAIASATLTARNEPSTPGALLADLSLNQTMRAGTWSLHVHNVLNSAWLDHISAYRALGLVAQGRWVELRFSASLKQKQKFTLK
jgi:iron complex outermembrane receptor protein